MNETKSFLSEIYENGGSATSRQIGCVVSRAQDRVRQWCRRNGLVTFDRTFKPSRWIITSAGIARLKELSPGLE